MVHQFVDNLCKIGGKLLGAVPGGAKIQKNLSGSVKIHEKSQPGRYVEERAGNRDFVVFLVRSSSGEAETPEKLSRQSVSGRCAHRALGRVRKLRKTCQAV